MSKSISISLAQKLDDTITKPGYLVEIPGLYVEEFNDILRLSSRDRLLTWRNRFYLPSLDFTISGISWDGTGTSRGRIEFNDHARFDVENSGTMSNAILYHKFAGKKIVIYLFYGDTTTDIPWDAVAGIFDGIIDETEIRGDGRVSMNIVSDYIITLHSPRRYIKPSDPVEDLNHYTGFNSVPAGGTIITWNNDNYKLERGDV